ncbi:MAG TPA: hypothetical protein PKX23_05635 [Verrucomicrobiota bacterium]|jgi:hypothetical protein|nr:hypothetical protein [Verrucomicrobiota bacterium]HRT07204.1 hypothetical protein [Candidatus Paceibacterota bacterium]HRT57084.1 hypothetical protein [Candidatus Paceibacterota bacterium]
MPYSLLLILALLIGAAGFAVRRRSELAGRLMIVGGCVGALACLIFQARSTLFTPGPKAPDRGQAAVAYFLAQQVLREAGDRQGVVLLLFPPEQVFDEDTVATYAGTFGRVLRGFPGLKVEVRRLAVTGKAALGGHLPLAAFQQATANVPSPAAYVSFTGVPPDVESLLSPPPPKGPGLFVFDPWGTTHWLAGLRQGRIRMVIVPRPGSPSGAAREIAGEPGAVLQQLYLTATPATADQIASQLGAK